MVRPVEGAMQFLSIASAAKKYDISEATLRNMIARRQLPVRRIGRRIRIEDAVLAAKLR